MMAPRSFARAAPVASGALLSALVSTSGCGAPKSASTTIFDPAGATASPAPVDIASSAGIETPFPALDGSAAGGGRWVGVGLLHGAVRMSRPSNWTVRDASTDEGHSFVRYVSPNAYSFAVYERDDSAGESWREILEHYEADVAANGAKATGQRVPVATGANQGRAYTIDRKIDSKDPVLSRSREILLRGAHHVVLVQIVTSEETLARIAGELLEVYRHLEVD
jgi:hypothetical protein